MGCFPLDALAGGIELPSLLETGSHEVKGTGSGRHRVAQSRAPLLSIAKPVGGGQIIFLVQIILLPPLWRRIPISDGLDLVGCS
jgi:hypothetical protein